MSSLEIAELTGKEHSKVMADIRQVLDEAGIGYADFGGSYSTKQNKVLSCFYLPRYECDLVVSGYSVLYRAAIISRWHELETEKIKNEISLPSNYIEALQALVVSETEKEELRLISAGQASQIEHQTEVIKQKDQYVIASNEASIKAGEILVREFCKSVDIVDIGEKQFYQWMRDKGIVSENNEPYSQFVKAGYFTYKPTEEMHGGKYRYTIRITPRGKVWLASKYLLHIDTQLES